MSKTKNLQYYYSRPDLKGKEEVINELDHQILYLKGIMEETQLFSRRLSKSQIIANRMNPFCQQLTYTIGFFEILTGIIRITPLKKRENYDLLLNFIAVKIGKIANTTFFVKYFT